MLDKIEANRPEFDAMGDFGAHLVVDALLEAIIAIPDDRPVHADQAGAFAD